MRLFFALCAQEGFVCLKVDATKMHTQTCLLRNNQHSFASACYEARFGSPTDRSMVLPVQHASQGHPESGALWEGFVNRVIARHGFSSTTRVARYLRMTKSWGLFYWRPKCLMSLPVGAFQPLNADSSLPVFPAPTHPTKLAGYVDAAHATDLVTRHSITGLVFMFCGGPIAYKSKIQSTVSTSSTETEFIAAVHAAKIAKYLQSILSELGYPQSEHTMLYEDNAAAILMVNASRPTPRSRHIDIQHFAIQKLSFPTSPGSLFLLIPSLSPSGRPFTTDMSVV
jgi:hypothetical protein